MYDRQCEKLAQHFLDDSYVGPKRDRIIGALSQSIQTYIEEWLNGLEAEEAREAEYNEENQLR